MSADLSLRWLRALAKHDSLRSAAKQGHLCCDARGKTLLQPLRGMAPCQAAMPAWIGPTQSALVSLEFACGAVVHPSIPMCFRASKSTLHLTICVGHVPDLARGGRLRSVYSRLEGGRKADELCSTVKFNLLNRSEGKWTEGCVNCICTGSTPVIKTVKHE